MRVLQETNFDGWSKAVKSFDQALKEKPDREREASILLRQGRGLPEMNRLKDALSEVELAKNLAGVSDVVIDKLASELVFANAKTAPEKKKALELARSTAQKYPYSGASRNELRRTFASGGRRCGGREVRAKPKGDHAQRPPTTTPISRAATRRSGRSR